MIRRGGQQDLIFERLVAAIRKDPDLDNDALKQRFGVSTVTIKKAREKVGATIPRQVIDQNKIKTPERWPSGWMGDKN